jgi:hypothetical protein
MLTLARALIALLLAAAAPSAMATLQQAGGLMFPLPPLLSNGTAIALSSVSAMSGANTSAAISLAGFVRFSQSTGSTKQIKSVGFATGAFNNTGGNSIIIDIEGIKTSSGAPASPDSTVCNSSGATLTVAMASMTASTWNDEAQTGTFGSNCTVSEGDAITVVFKWSGTPNAAASFTLQGLGGANSGGHLPQTATTTTGSPPYTASAVLPNVVLNFSDSSFGTLDGAYVMKTQASTASFGSGSSPNEFGNCWTPAFTGAVNGVWFYSASSSTTNTAAVEITDNGTPTVLATSSTINGNYFVNAASSIRAFWGPIAETTLNAGTTYCVGYKATGANAGNTVQLQTVSVNGHWALNGSTGYQYATRAGGAWTTGGTPTQRALIGVRYSKLDDGAGGGGASAKCIIGGSLRLRDPLLPDPDQVIARLMQELWRDRSYTPVNDNRPALRQRCAA